MPQSRLDRRRVGREKEALAARFLGARGLVILVCNYQCRAGEIDLIADHLGTLVFVEVRFRSRSMRGGSLDTVNHAKQRKILRCAQYFLLRNPHLAYRPCRFDVVGIDQEKYPQSERVRWITDAFQLSGW